MSTVKDEVQSLLNKLPEDCTLEDVQYHLYVIEKIERGVQRAEIEGTITQEEAERLLSHLPNCMVNHGRQLHTTLQGSLIMTVFRIGDGCLWRFSPLQF
jgi:hypothetical protein